MLRKKRLPALVDRSVSMSPVDMELENSEDMNDSRIELFPGMWTQRKTHNRTNTSLSLFFFEQTYLHCHSPTVYFPKDTPDPRINTTSLHTMDTVEFPEAADLSVDVCSKLAIFTSILWDRSNLLCMCSLIIQTSWNSTSRSQNLHVFTSMKGWWMSDLIAVYYICTHSSSFKWSQPARNLWSALYLRFHQPSAPSSSR